MVPYKKNDDTIRSPPQHAIQYAGNDNDGNNDTNVKTWYKMYVMVLITSLKRRLGKLYGAQMVISLLDKTRHIFLLL